jgi:uncharacterized membrane protein YjgN (DUF898 family)
MNRLKFEGKGFDFFKILFVDVILVIVSLTLLYPRAIVREARYLWSETTLGGTPFEFRGTTKAAFNGYMKVLLYFVFFMILMVAEGVTLTLLYGEIPYFVQYFNSLFILVFVFFFAPIVIHGDLGFFTNNTAWRSVKASYKGKYIMEHLRFGSLRFGYSGSSKELFRIYLKGFFLGIVTLGIYNIWNFRDLYNYTVNHTIVRKGEQEFSLHSDANTRQVFEMLIGNVLLVVLTFGFGASWAYMRFFRFMMNHCVIPAEFNLVAIEDNESDEEPQKPSDHWLDKWNPVLIA